MARWFAMTLGGLRCVEPELPVCHVSYYEADAFARWAGAICRPKRNGKSPRNNGSLSDAFGIVWQWTRSAYSPYPGYRAAPGALGEYNGKFMVNQLVLRGSSLATPAGHSRAELSQFLLPAGALAVLRTTARGISTLRTSRRAEQWPLPCKPRSARCRPSKPRTFAADVLEGLTAKPKRLAPKYFYDLAGSALFERITQLPEYYPTRCEIALLRQHAPAIASLFPPNCALIEFGAGSSRKARILLGAAATIEAYVPVDISGEFLRGEAAQLRPISHASPCIPVVADFTRAFEIPRRSRRRRASAFSGLHHRQFRAA